MILEYCKANYVFFVDFGVFSEFCINIDYNSIKYYFGGWNTSQKSGKYGKIKLKRLYIVILDIVKYTKFCKLCIDYEVLQERKQAA